VKKEDKYKELHGKWQDLNGHNNANNKPALTKQFKQGWSCNNDNCMVKQPTE